MAHELLQIDVDGRILEDVPCSSCNAPLKGENAGGYCSNCGAVNALSLLGRAGVHTDAQGKIAEPVVCLNCAYPLIGVDPTGVCPECHSPVGPALEASLLRYGNPRWLKKVNDGLLLYFIAMMVAIGLAFGNMGLGIALKNDPALRTIIGMSTTLVMGIFMIIAVWWVTAPDPDTPLPLQKRGGANLARLLIVPQFALSLPSIYFTNAATTPAGQMQAGLISMPIQLIGLLVSVGIVLHLIQLARRAVDEKLERWGKIILWLSIGGTLLAILGGSIVMASMLASGMTAGGGGAGGGATAPSGSAILGLAVGGFGGCIGSLIALVAMIWLAVLIFKLRAHYGMASKIAAHRL